MPVSRRLEKPLVPEAAKLAGAHYTDKPVATFLCRWGLRRPIDQVADPSFGGGVFLEAAAERLLQLGGSPMQQVFGVELDEAVLKHTAGHLRQYGVTPNTLFHQDFFSVDASTFAVDVMAGNPPFIRHHRFQGPVRERAMARMSAQDVRLSAASSSWAPFVVHAASFLKPGGRLALVLPTELLHATYALPVLKFLAVAFRSATFLTFERRLFPDISQDTLLLLADGYTLPATRTGEHGVFLWKQLDSSDDLRRLQVRAGGVIGGLDILPLNDVLAGGYRLAQRVVSRSSAALIDALAHQGRAVPLGQLAQIKIGYVSGDNAFFHYTSERQAAEQHLGLDAAHLVPAVRRARALSGLSFTAQDWAGAVSSGDACHVLHLNASTRVTPAMRRYLQCARAGGAGNSRKCGDRVAWYAIPQVEVPDAFLVSMSTAGPLLIENAARVVAPNSLHTVFLRSAGSGDHAAMSPKVLGLFWMTAVAQLGIELSGHALGGGLLKLEPKEACRVMVPIPNLPMDDLEAAATAVDAMLRRGYLDQARRHADEVVLEQGLGLSAAQCHAMRREVQILALRREPKT
ncbi:N-6 DNA methylase [Deinococcus sp. UYEF24]